MFSYSICYPSVEVKQNSQKNFLPHPEVQTGQGKNNPILTKDLKGGQIYMENNKKYKRRYTACSYFFTVG